MDENTPGLIELTDGEALRLDYNRLLAAFRESLATEPAPRWRPRHLVQRAGKTIRAGRDAFRGGLQRKQVVRLAADGPGTRQVAYTCNVCGSRCRSAVEVISRESPSCHSCRSTVRMREVAYLISIALFGAGLPLPELPVRPSLRGIGMSDWWEYADRLAERVTYTNTWYHRDPRLDVTDVPDTLAGTCDVVVATDVFEHVVGPPQRAFGGAARLLKPAGSFVFTVPWFHESGETVEHFPDAVGYDVVEVEGRHEVDLIKADGSRHRAVDPVFHGGDGSTLEMRLFTLEGIFRGLAAAGFKTVRVLREEVPEFGILHPVNHSLAILATGPVEADAS